MQRKLLLNEDKDVVSLQQLLRLGAGLEQAGGGVTFISPETLAEAYNNDRHKLTIRADYWISWLLDTFEKMESPNELNWLIASAKFLQFHGETEMVRRIRVVVNALEKLDLYSDLAIDLRNSLLYLWLEDFLTDYTDAPGVIYIGKKRSRIIKREAEFEENKDNGQQNIVDAATEVLFQEKEVVDGSMSQLDKENKKRLLIKSLLIKGLRKFKPTNVRLKFLLDILQNTKGFTLTTLLSSKDFLRGSFKQVISDAEIKKSERKAKIRKELKVTQMLKKSEIAKKNTGIKAILKNEYVKAYAGLGFLLTVLDVYDAGNTLANPSRTAKENRDAYATLTFVGGDLLSTGVMTALGASTGVGILVSGVWTVGSFVYSGFSMLYEYWDENFSAWERYVTYSLGFMQMDLHPKLQAYLDHKQLLNEMANDFYSILQEKPHVYFIASGIGKYNPIPSFEEFITNKYGSKMWVDINVRGLTQRNGLPLIAPPRKDPTPFKKEYDAFAADFNVLLPDSINLKLDEYQTRKISRLTPKIPSDATLFCGPNFREDEPESTASEIKSEWFCDNSFMIARESFAKTSAPGTGIFDFRLVDKGLVALYSKKVNFSSEFFLGNGSKILIFAPRDNSPNNRFIFPVESFYGKVIGDPDYGTLSNTISMLDMSQVNEKYTIDVNYIDINIRETATNEAISRAAFQYIQGYIGHVGPDIINCKITNIESVITKGGTSENIDSLTDCKQAIVSSYTHIKNTESGPAYYTIQPNSSHIDMHLLNESTVIKLPESIKTFLKNYQFKLDAEANILIIKKIDSDNYLLKIIDYIRLNSTIQFIDVDKITIIPNFIVDVLQEETTSIPNKFHVIMQGSDREKAIATHRAIVENNPDSEILGQFYYASTNVAKQQAILGTKGNDLFLIEPTDVDYVAGNEGADIYKIKDKESTFPTLTFIDNYSSSLSPEIDEIHLPSSKDQISCWPFDYYNDLLCTDEHDIQLYFKNALTDSAYQHFLFVDKDNKAFIPMWRNSNKIDLIPYYSIQQVNRFPEIEFDTLDTSSPFQVTIEGDLPTSFQLYRDWNRVRLVGYGQDAVSANLVIAVPIEQFKSTSELKIFSTHHAGVINERTASTTLRFGDYYQQLQDITSLVQIDHYIHSHKITWKNLRFDNTIEMTIEKDPQLTYLSLDHTPSDIEVKANENNLLIILYNDQRQSSTIKVINGRDPAQRLQGIIIKEKLLPISLADQDFDDESLEALTNVFRINLIRQWIKEQVDLIPFQLRQDALFKIVRSTAENYDVFKAVAFLEQINLGASVEKEKIIRFFINDILEDKRDITFTPEEEKEIEKVILLIYANYVLQNAQFNYADVTYPFLSQPVHNLLFKDFELMMPRNFLLLNEKIQSHLLDPYIALHAIFDIASKEKKQQLVESYSFKLEELIRENPREKVISHNINSRNYKIGEIELDDLPISGEYTLDGNDALLTVYNDNAQPGTLRIKGWNDLHHRLERIVIKGKSIPITLSFSPESQEANTKSLRRHLVDLWIEKKLTDVSLISKEKALFKIIEQIHQTSSLEKALDLYPLWGYKSQEDLRVFYEGYSSKAISDEEENETTNAFILYYTQILAFYSNYFEDFSKLIPEESHDFFSSTLFQGNYSLTEIIRFRDTLFNPRMLKKVLPKIITSGKEYYTYEIGNNQFYARTTDIVIYHNLDPNDIRLGYLCFDKYPANLEMKADKNDLLLTLYNDEGQSRTIRITNWSNPLNRLEYIIVAGKKLSSSLAFFPLEQKFLDELTVKLRWDLLNEWLDAELNTLDSNSKSSVIVTLAEQLLTSPLYQADLRYKLFDFDSAESFLQFYKNERKKTQNAYLTKEEMLNRQKATLLYYAKFYIKYPKDIHIFRGIVSEEVHDRIFEKDFRKTISVDFLRVSKQFKKNISSLATEASENYLAIPQKNKKFDNSLRLHEEENRHSNIRRYTLIEGMHSDIYVNQIPITGGGSFTEPVEERKDFFLDLGLFSEKMHLIRSFSITQKENDLILTCTFDWENTIARLTFKNYDNPAHRISGIIADNQIIYDKLKFIQLEDSASLERVLNGALIKAQAQIQRQKILKNSKDEFILKGFLISQALANSREDLSALAKAFGFNSPGELLKFHHDYVTTYLQENRSIHPVHRIYTDKGALTFLRLIYLYVMEASPTPLTIDQLQQAFPSLDETKLTKFVQAYRTVPYSKYNVREKDVTLSDYFIEVINAELNTVERDALLTPRIIRVPKGNKEPYLYSGNYTGFKEKVYLDLADIHYDQVDFIARRNVATVFLRNNKRITKKILITDWSDPLFQLHGLVDTRKDWQNEFPRVVAFSDLENNSGMIRYALDKLVKEATPNKRLDEIFDNLREPSVAENRMNVHSLDESDYRGSANKASQLEEKRSWLQSTGYWVFGTAGAALSLGGGLLCWLSRRRLGLKSNGMGIVGIGAGVTEKLLEEGVVEATHVEMPLTMDSEAYSNNTGYSLLDSENSQREGVKNDSIWPAEFSGLDLPLHENLILSDFLIRYGRGEKYVNPIGNYSLERQHASRLAELEKKVKLALFTKEEAWANRAPVFDEAPYFVGDGVNEDHSTSHDAFSIDNLDIENANCRKIKSQKKKSELERTA